MKIKPYVEVIDNDKRNFIIALDNNIIVSEIINSKSKEATKLAVDLMLAAAQLIDHCDFTESDKVLKIIK